MFDKIGSFIGGAVSGIGSVAKKVVSWGGEALETVPKVAGAVAGGISAATTILKGEGTVSISGADRSEVYSTKTGTKTAGASLLGVSLPVAVIISIGLYLLFRGR